MVLSMEFLNRMNKDIISESDIDKLVREFYKDATKDPLIGHFFSEVVQLDFDHHISRIVSFWNSVLFSKGDYIGNPMLKHIELHQKSELNKSHFDRWLELWIRTIDLNFKGEVAELCKQKAKTISQLVLYKIMEADHPGFIQ